MNKATSDRQRLLEALKRGPVNSYDATFKFDFGKQAPARKRELQLMGYDIKSLPSHGRSVDWILNESKVRTTQEGLSDSGRLVQSPTSLGHYCFYGSFGAYVNYSEQERMGI